MDKRVALSFVLAIVSVIALAVISIQISPFLNPPEKVREIAVMTPSPSLPTVIQTQTATIEKLVTITEERVVPQEEATEKSIAIRALTNQTEPQKTNVTTVTLTITIAPVAIETVTVTNILTVTTTETVTITRTITVTAGG